VATAISLATTAAEREAVYRFRYQVYVREMGRREPNACHATGRLTDDLDRAATVLRAIDAPSGSLLGTLRTNFLRNADVGHYESLYRLDQLSAADRQCSSVTTRLMVAAAHRGGPIGLHLAIAVYGIGLEHDIDYDYIDCNPPLVPFFTRLGYRWLRMIEHPQYGTVSLMRLDLKDEAHLTDVRSPFLRALRDHRASAHGVLR